MSPSEQDRGRAELREWVVPGRHQAWLVAAAEAHSTEELAAALGPPRLALQRCQVLLEDLSQPLYTRRLWAHMARVLCARLARSAK